MVITKIQLLGGEQLFKIVRIGTIGAMFNLRLRKLRDNLKKEKLEAVFICNVANITYLTGYDNFSKYEREAYLLIGNNFQYIITDGRYSEAIKKQVSHFKLFQRSHQTPTEKLFQDLKKQINSLGIDENELTVSEHKLLTKHFKKTKHFDTDKLRSIKEDGEIEKIAKACKLGDLAFKYILKKISSGVSEKEIANYLERFIREKGAEVSFPPIVAFGKNSSIPHHQTGQDVLGPSTRFTRSGREGLIVLLDFGVKFENYCSDMTRTVFFGTPSVKQKEIYQTVLEAQQKAVEFLNNQIKFGKKVIGAEADKIARNYIIKKGYSSIPHSLGHGVGLKVHEYPSLSPKNKEELRIGMVFSIEPGIYIPDFGGVRIEDLYVLEKTGLRQLTTSSKEIIRL